MPLALNSDDVLRQPPRVEFRPMMNTVFAFVVRKLQFGYSLPVSIALTAISAVAWILFVIEMRRTLNAPSNVPETTQPLARGVLQSSSVRPELVLSDDPATPDNLSATYSESR